ncbi:flagellar assembly protein FliW [Romboutsia sp. 1001216sp1]|uniref:flagellar assembly protein FliW n=1 Tax=unclassified Romboutsia TaxID=2626894 RepID=UPI0018A99ED6|nr:MULTISPECIES: flagellar assembly protein FliW [unclassified Romboutsia]MDB8792339.1 flagellar assembly protein FliW [Romboutsia sp. 1001216sp1]MDB8795634.1 flagellar assembly protein FliW [Romboutsia sp. 1001216sp1]MDB8798487.1 flagellar assembly protein FliW [Romboutsia sp. 1001216sp1]
MDILFEKGIPGFENYNTFLVEEIKGDKNFFSMISKDDLNIGFVCVSPFEIKKNYEIELNEDTINELRIKDYKDVLVLSLITLGNSIDTSTVNLRAPIIININNNRGKQLILEDTKYNIKEPLTGSENNASN